METPGKRESCGCGCERPIPHLSFAKQRPPGLVFRPLDHQLIGFLRRKISGQPLQPPHPFMDLNVYKHTPQQLSELNGCGEREGEWYFFTTRDRKYKNGTRPNREAGGGFWKATGCAEGIVHDGQVIGWKRSLVYYHGKPQNGIKTNWIMHEFTAKDADYDNNNNPTRTTGENDMRLDGYVICKIHMNRRKSELKDRIEEGSDTGQRKRKIMASTKDGRKAPHRDPDHRDFHAESSSPVPGRKDEAPLEPRDRAPVAELPSMCRGVPMPDQKQQQPQAMNCFKHDDTSNDLVANAQPLDMFDLRETQEQQQQTANHDAISSSHPNVSIDSVAPPPNMPLISLTQGQPHTATDPAVAANFNPASNASGDSTWDWANAMGGLSMAGEDSSASTADLGDDLLGSNESSLWRYFDYGELKVAVDMNSFEDCTAPDHCTEENIF